MNEKISGKQASSVFILYWVGGILLVGIGVGAKQDAWISTIIALLFMVPTILVYNKIIALYPEKGLFDILFELFGKIAGRIMATFLVADFLFLGGIIIRAFSEFIQIENLPETPQILTVSMMGLTCIMACKYGIENLGRLCRMLVVVVSFIIVSTFLLSIKNMNFSYIKPIMGSGLPVILDSAAGTYSFPLAEGFIFITMFPFIETKSKPKRLLFFSLLLTGLLYLTAGLRNLFVLGPFSSAVYFPAYQATGTIAIGEFFTRIEVLVGINILIAGFVRVCICIFSASVGLAKIFNTVNYRPLAAPCGLILITISRLAANNTQEYINFIKVYRNIMLPFQIFLPLLLMITAIIKQKVQKVSAQPDVSETMAD